MLLRFHVPEQKDNFNKHLCRHPQSIENNPNILENIIACDKSCFFHHCGRKTKHMKVYIPSNDVVYFFDNQRIVHVHDDWIPEDQTVNQIFYKDVLTEWV